MAIKVSLGAAIGIVASLLSLNGNRAFHHVTLFPDLFTPLALLGLTWLAVWFCVHREQSGDRAWQAGRTISITSGLIFGTMIAVLTIARFGFHHIPVLLIIVSFLTAFVAALVCGIVASVLVKYTVRHSR